MADPLGGSSGGAGTWINVADSSQVPQWYNTATGEIAVGGANPGLFLGSGDQFGNGIDPSTGLPWGVRAVARTISPSGFVYGPTGAAVNRDGSAYTGGSTGSTGGGGSSGGGGGGGSSSGGSVTTIETDPVSGRRYRAVNGIFSSWMDPVSAGNYGDTTNYPGDANGDGLNDSTGRANGVTSVPTSISPTGFVYGTTPVWPNGAPYVAGDRTQPQIIVDRDGSITGRAGTSYYVGSDGVPHILVTGLASQQGGGSSGGSTSNAGTYGGGGGSSGGGGGSNSTSTHLGGYNNTNTNVSTSTSFNTSDIGPNSLANSAADRAQRAAEFAATNALQKSEAQRAAAADYARLLSQVDPNAYQAFLAANGGGRLDNALLSGGNALSADAINPAAMALAAARGQEYNPSTGAGGGGGGAGGGLQVGGGGPTSPGATGGGSTQSGGSGSPAAAPADTSYDYWANNIYTGPRASVDANGNKTQPAMADLQAQYQAWLASQPAPGAAGPVDPYTAQYGAPPEGYGSWQDWLMTNGPSWLKQMSNNPQGGGFDLSTPENVARFSQWIEPYKQQQTAAGTALGPSRMANGELMWGDMAARQPLLEAQWRSYQGIPRLAAPQGAPGTPYNPSAPGGGTQSFDPSLPGYTASGSRTGGLTTTAASLPPGTTVTTGGGTAAAPSYNTISPPAGNYPGTTGTGYGGSGLPEDVYYGAHGTDFTNPATGKIYPAYTVQPQAATNFQQPYPDLGKNPDGTPVSPVQLKTAPHWDPATNQWVPTLAMGGTTRAPMMITGDPQRDGRPNPEIIHNPTGAPISVTPMRNMGGLPRPNAMAMQHANPMARFMRPMPMMRMGGLPRYAYGTYDKPTTGGSTTDFSNTTNVPTTPAPPGYYYAGDILLPIGTTAPVSTEQPAQTYPYTPPSGPGPMAPTTFAGSGEGGGYIAPTQPEPTTANDPTKIGNYSTAPGTAGQPAQQAPEQPTPVAAGTTTPVATPTSPLEQPGNLLFNEVLYTRLAATNPWMNDPTSYMNVDYLTRDPVARRLYEQWLTMRYGVPQESIDFAQARNRLGGASMASMGQSR